MGLTAEDMGDVRRLAALASGTPKSKRNDIYMAVAGLYRMQNAQLSERERALMRDILKRLTHDVEMAIRISLAETLADDPEAPPDLILLLADDAIEVARPIILRSRQLTDEDILEFLAHADIARQAVCAERPHIGEPVTDKLAASEAESVLVALVRNLTARIATSTFATLVEKSRRFAKLQEPLAQRKDLPAPLAERMCLWASDAIKSFILENRRLDPVSLSGAFQQATRAVTAAPAADAPEGGRKLVDKLAVAGQLKPGFLVRVLQQGQTDLFDIAFAKLLEVEPTDFREIFYRRGARPVALACKAVGIDRCVFPTIYCVSRQSRSINPILSHEERTEIDAVFGSLTRKEALGILRRIA
ncbi:MAG TPA: DUF2336 domain-containing protein [Rhizomicrobium sp.]|nr:DUF2336 domain-containing protein [Rhizomicrobium sp.]